MIAKIKSVFQKKQGDTYIGLVDEDGLTKGSSKNEYSMSFSLCAYSKNNGPLEEKEAVVHKIIPSYDFSIEGLEPLTIVELTGEQISYHGQDRIRLISVNKTKTTHPELQKVLQKRLEPVTYKSEFFGTFLLDRRAGWFEAEAKWLGTEIELFLSGDLGDIPDLEAQAIQLFEKQAEWDSKIRARITQDLLRLKNDTWLDEDEDPLSEQEFQEKIQLDNFVVYKDGDFAAWYNDGDTFWGHSISVDGNLDGRLTEVGIHG